MSVVPPIQPRSFEAVSDPAVLEYFKQAIAGGPLTARPLPKLVERLVHKPWASRLAVLAKPSGLVLGRAGGPQVEVRYWQHIQTFQVHYRTAEGEESLVGQGVHAGLVERIVSEAAARLLSPPTPSAAPGS